MRHRSPGRCPGLCATIGLTARPNHLKVQGNRLLPKKVTLWRGNRPPFAFRVPLTRSQYKRNICHFNAYNENCTLQNGGGEKFKNT